MAEKSWPHRSESKFHENKDKKRDEKEDGRNPDIGSKSKSHKNKDWTQYGMQKMHKITFEFKTKSHKKKDWNIFTGP